MKSLITTFTAFLGVSSLLSSVMGKTNIFISDGVMVRKDNTPWSQGLPNLDATATWIEVKGPDGRTGDVSGSIGPH